MSCQHDIKTKPHELSIRVGTASYRYQVPLEYCTLCGLDAVHMNVVQYVELLIAKKILRKNSHTEAESEFVRKSIPLDRAVWNMLCQDMDLVASIVQRMLAETELRVVLMGLGQPVQIENLDA